MPRNVVLLTKRNEHIKKRFRFYRKRNPKWTVQAVIGEVATEMFLSDITIVKILKSTHEENVPAPSTIYRNKPAATA